MRGLGAAALVAAVLAGCAMAGPSEGKPADKREIVLPKSKFKDPGRAAEYFLCFWNVENLFDDIKDGRTMKVDDEYDKYFAERDDHLAAKLEKLAGVLAKMNGGKGPDIL